MRILVGYQHGCGWWINNTDSQNGIFFLGNGQNLENMKALSALIPKIEKILISVVKILWGEKNVFFLWGPITF